MEKPASRQIDDIIKLHAGWRGQMLSRLRALITTADPTLVEAVKWKMPSRPEGVPVWTHNGKNICMGDTLKSAVRLTFPKGAQLDDPHKLFNSRLTSNTVRAIDFHESDTPNEAALQELVREAVAKS